MALSRHDDLSLPYVLSVPSDKPDEEPAPLLIFLHGRGADANDLADLAPMLDGPGGYRFVFPNAPKPFEAYPGTTFGYTWFDGWPPTSIADSRSKLLAFIEEVADRYLVEDDKIILVGFSQGGLMAIDAGFRTQRTLRGIVVMSGAVYEEDLPDLSARKWPPVLIIHGTADDVIPVIAARRTRRLLEEHGIEPEYHELQMGHHVTPESLAIVAEFIHRCLAER